ncbi:sigma-54-dependent Fis family transcriptional regulator [Diaphorobacter sp. HDW4A]|uniref:sigma-54-dependent Fis family transcriptional regulator n=1 Tax=Diaphorobacter sp. HDW4A TaxID=2714924 RepID=UPI00140A860B|nr:sigma-54-dependent Fis family transcriptional regulator [Diaphorobacter sp. HDW4A]QIL82580.1 sigma-54-dependent Fis family transcriptional regulator [Diaphorobacter sp. HDW4A]
MSTESFTRLPAQQNASATAAPVALDHHVAQVLDKANRRSQTYGVAVHDEPDYSSPSRGHMSNAMDENRFLFQHAAPIMETLFGQIANTHSMVLLTSAQGMVLHSLGDNDFLEKASRVALVPGMDWSEKTKGTNAIGTALSEEEAITVHGDQHYMSANQALTCSCSPIFDPHGQVIGALDVTGDHRSYHQHTLALVRMSAQLIENHMFADSFPKAVRLHFHSRPEFLGTLVEGIAVFSPDGRFISANRSAQFQLGLSHHALKAHTFSSLFNLPMSALFELFSGSASTPRQLGMHNGVSVWCRTEIKPAGPWAPPSLAPVQRDGAPTTAPQPTRATVSAAESRCKPHLSSLQYLDTGDAQIASVIQKLRRIVDRDIPVMVLGETGTGKDLLAQAIHNDSARARQPFVPVNCASIPESLIEAELFGYEEGAFTGARKKGSVGKIVQAHGGTLFLDEIGDMPKHLQARLLRVLQERKVSPLGASKEVEVDVTVICATHKNIKDMIARGEFREDLYYRLNGLIVRLPALRERTDFEVVVKKVLKSLCDSGQQIDISPEVMSLLSSYHWPGNLRQLHNLLRTAAVMVGDHGSIDAEHLPDDFLEELRIGDSAPLAIEATVIHSATAASANSDDEAPDSARLHDVTLNAMAQMLRTHKGNVSAAAKALGVSRNTIYRKKNLLPPDLLN